MIGRSGRPWPARWGLGKRDGVSDVPKVSLWMAIEGSEAIRMDVPRRPIATCARSESLSRDSEIPCPPLRASINAVGDRRFNEYSIEWQMVLIPNSFGIIGPNCFGIGNRWLRIPMNLKLIQRYGFNGPLILVCWRFVVGQLFFQVVCKAFK